MTMLHCNDTVAFAALQHTPRMQALCIDRLHRLVHLDRHLSMSHEQLITHIRMLTYNKTLLTHEQCLNSGS